MYKLREIEKSDLIIINRLRSDKELMSCLVSPFRYINFETDEKWYSNYMQNRDKNVRCAVIDENETVMGFVYLTNIDWNNRTCVFGIMVLPEFQGKGVGKFAIKEMINHAFINMNLHRIELRVLATNDRAIKLYEKNGFVREGCLRKSNYKNGEYVDMFVYSLLKEDYIKG